MRKFTTLFFLLFAMTVGSQVFAFEYEGLSYTVISPENKTVSVSALSGDLSGNVVIPEKVIDGETEYTVTEVAQNGFRLCSKINSLVMPNTITKIGMDAFWGCSLLGEVTLSDKLESIGNFGFNSCTSLKTIDLPASLKTIGNQAFANCTSLENFTVDEANTNFTVDGGVLFSKDKTILVSYPNKKGSVYIVPSFVNTIGANAFFGCSNLTKAIVGKSVTSIEEGAFYMCGYLKEIVLTNSIKTLGDWTFAYCGALKSIVLPKDITSIGNDLFAGCSSLQEIVIPEMVQSIGNQAFHSCRSLAKIVIPENVKNIGDQAFKSCLSLAKVEWNNQITTVGSEAFSGCEKLKVMEISSPVTEIGIGTFYGCSELKKLVLPAELESLSDAIILDCENLDTVVCYAVNPPTCSQWAFEGLPANCKLYVPAGTSDDYSKAYGWDKFINVFEMEGTSIEENISETVRVYAFDGKLAVDGLSQSAQVVVYGLDGRKVVEFTAKPGNNVFELNSGLYLVRCGGKVVKVIL